MKFYDQYKSILRSPVLGIATCLFFISLLVFSGTSPEVISSYMPHRYCIRDRSLIMYHQLSDILIGTSYMVISSILIYYRKKVAIFRPTWVTISFATFIITCGWTHYMAVLTMWFPFYRTEAMVKLVCALASLSTASAMPYVVLAMVRMEGGHETDNTAP